MKKVIESIFEIERELAIIKHLTTLNQSKDTKEKIIAHASEVADYANDIQVVIEG